MPDYVLIRHKVRSFNEWKPAYDAHLPEREAAGMTESHLLQGKDDPNEVIILFEADDLAKARVLMESEEIREVMQKAGVMDKPDIFYLTASSASSVAEAN